MPNSIRSSGVTSARISPSSAISSTGLPSERKPIAFLPETLADDLVDTDERAAADEQDVARVDLDVLLLGMLAATLRRDVADRALEHLEQRLLHAFALTRRA
jgi:hypothetical protein